MEKLFVPYELALKLKELGFVFYPFGYYSLLEDNKIIESTFYASDDFLEAPLWQQAFDWIFRQFNYDWGLHIGTLFITINCKINNKYYKTSELTKEACLEKLIELCEKN